MRSEIQSFLKTIKNWIISWKGVIILFSLCNIISFFHIIKSFMGFNCDILSGILQLEFPERMLEMAETYFSVTAAMWIAGTAVLIFILGRARDLIYGIKMINIIRWETDPRIIVLAGVCYALLFPVGLYACIRTDMEGILEICVLTYLWLIGASCFTAWYSRKTNIFNMIKDISLKLIKQECITGDQFFYEKKQDVLNKTPLMSMIRNMEYDNVEETQVVKDCIADICDLLQKKEDISFRYPLLMPIVSAICENSGFSTRNEIARTVELCADLLDNNPKQDIWIKAGIILPMIEQTEKCKSGKSYATILKGFPWTERQEMVIISLLYVDYLRSCGDDSEQRIEILMQMDPIAVIRENMMSPRKKETLYMIWISWQLLNKQDEFNVFLVKKFIDGCNDWDDDEKIKESYVLSKLKWEEMRQC